MLETSFKSANSGTAQWAPKISLFTRRNPFETFKVLLGFEVTMSSDTIATALGAALPGALFAGLGAVVLAWSRKQSREADSFENLVVQPLAQVLQAAKSAPDGDAGIAAVRGVVCLDQPEAAIAVPGVAEPVAAVSDSYWLRKMKIVEGKLRESNEFAGETKATVPWHLRDASEAVAVADSSYALPLTAGPKFHEPVTDPGHLELWASRHGITIKNSADRERVIGIGEDRPWSSWPLQCRLLFTAAFSLRTSMPHNHGRTCCNLSFCRTHPARAEGRDAAHPCWASNLG